MQQGKQASDLGRRRSAIAGDSGGEAHSTAGAPQFDPNDPVELVSRIGAGDESVWRDMSDQYESLLRWIARQCRLPAEDTDDVVQLTWLHCLEHINQLTDPHRLGGWLATICRRECIRLATKGRREVPHSGSALARLIDGDRADGDPSVEVVVHDQNNRLYTAISVLPERQKKLLVELLRQGDQSYLDLSRRLGLPVGSIGPTRQRAVTRLRLDPRLADLSSEIAEDHPHAWSA
jgi:RNA polymerase sigma factor (sigma-70 family)